jgi:hypothetical protein
VYWDKEVYRGVGMDGCIRKGVFGRTGVLNKEGCSKIRSVN